MKLAAHSKIFHSIVPGSLSGGINLNKHYNNHDLIPHLVGMFLLSSWNSLNKFVQPPLDCIQRFIFFLICCTDRILFYFADISSP